MVEHKGPRAWLQSANSKLSRLQKRPPQDSEDISAPKNAINSKKSNSPSPTIGQAVEPPRGRIELPGDQVAANIGDTGQDAGSSKDGPQLQEHQAPVDSDSPDFDGGESEFGAPERTDRADTSISPPTAEGSKPRNQNSSLRGTLWDKALEVFKAEDEDKYNGLKSIGVDEDDPFVIVQSMVNDKKLRERGIRPEVEGVIVNILDYKDFLISVANFDPTKATAVVFRGVFHILQVSINDVANLRGVLDDMEVVASTMGYWTDIEFRYSLSAPNTVVKGYQSLNKPLIQLYKRIIEFLAHVHDECRLSRTVQLFKTSGRQNRRKVLVGQIKMQADLCKQEFDSCKATHDQSQGVREWLSAHDAHYDHKDICTKIKLKSFPGCAKWLLDSGGYTRWSKGVNETLWVRGTVGTGKTALMAQIIQKHLNTPSKDPQVRIAFCYCSKKSHSEGGSSNQVLRSLLRQAAYDRISGTMTQNVYDARIRGDTYPENSDDCEMLLAGVLKTGIKLKIFIDALDECEESRELLAVLKRLRNGAPSADSFLLLVTGRPHVNVCDYFPTAIQVNVAAHRTRDELQNFVKTWMSLLDEHEKLLGGGKEHKYLEDELIRLVCEKAEGMFRWAELQLLFFHKRKTSFKLATQVQEELAQLCKNTLRGAEALKDIYEKIYQDNISNGGTERDLAVFAYQILIAAKRKVTVDFMCQALTWYMSTLKHKERITEGLVYSLTNNFVITTQGYRIVFPATRLQMLSFAHVSALEYLQTLPEYTSSRCQGRLASACIKCVNTQNPVLHKERFPESALRQLYMNFQSKRAVNQRYSVETEVLTWELYAIKYWGPHCKSIDRIERDAHGIGSLLFEYAKESSLRSNFFEMAVVDYSENDKRPRHGTSVVVPLGKDSIAAQWGLVELLEALYASDQKDSYLKASRLSDCAHIAAEKRELSVLQLIIMKWNDLDPSQRNSDGGKEFKTPLYSAIAYYNHDAVEFALLNGYQPNDEPLVAQAVRFQDWTMMKLLLEHQVDPNVPDWQGKNALQYARKEKNQDKIALLLRFGAIDTPMQRNKPKDPVQRHVELETSNSLVLSSSNSDLYDDPSG